MCNTDCAHITHEQRKQDSGRPIGAAELEHQGPIHIVQRYVEFHEDKYCSNAVHQRCSNFVREYCSRAPLLQPPEHWPPEPLCGEGKCYVLF